MNRAVETQLIKARTYLYINQPFYGILSLRMMLKEVHKDPRVQTLRVSHTTIYYNPDFVATLTPLLTASAICHELQHIMLNHIDRCGARNPETWNAACDYVVNANLKTDGMPIGDGWLYHPKFAGMTAEHIYTLLPDTPAGGGSGGYGALDSMQASADETAASENAADWDVAVINAAAAAKEAGKVPASIARQVEELTAGRVNWQERLRRFVTAHSKNDYSWNRPQRRMIPFGYYLPSLHSLSMNLLVTAIDTSGSIDRYTLNAFASEVIAAKNAARPQGLMSIYCDAAVNHVDVFGEYDEVRFDMHGGGGTDFSPPFEHVKAEGVKPDCLVYLTDGYGPFPSEPPPYPVLWVMTTGKVAPWGETVRIEV